MSDVTLTVGSDTADYVRGTAKMQDGIKKVGAEMDKLGQKTKSVGQDMASAGKQADESFGKAVINAGRLVVAARAAMQALRAAGTSLTNSLGDAASRSASKGDTTLKFSRLARDSGMDQKFATSWRDSLGAATDEEKLSLMESISKANASGAGLSSRRINELFSALQSGAFSVDQVKAGVESGQSFDVQAGRDGLSDSARREIDLRRGINAINAQPGALSGSTARISDAIRQSDDRSDPAKKALRDIIPTVSNFFMTGNAIAKALEQNPIRVTNSDKRLNVSGAVDNPK